MHVNILAQMAYIQNRSQQQFNANNPSKTEQFQKLKCRTITSCCLITKAIYSVCR